ncbi:MAG: adenylate/guanylate cyclase domain-containing protein [Desulfobaccales bacterium]|nr:adenylate/guanylate cyclase domain-containing protein [Desulfobaccales bacterium]
MIRRLAPVFKSPTTRWVVGVTLLLSIFLIWRPPFTEFLELKLYDLKFRYRGARAGPADIAIVAIDDDSLKKVGRWPWSREDIARLFTRLKETGPKVIALDIIFAEKQETAVVRTLTTLRQEVARRGLASPALLALLEAEQKRADVDRLLAQVIGQGTPTILGFFFREVGGTVRGLKPEKLLGPSYIQASTYNLVRTLDTESSQVPLIGAAGVELNLPEISAAAAGGGYFNMMPDPDGIVRWFPMSIIYGPDIFAPLTLVAVDHYLGRPPLAITLSRLGVEDIRIGSRQVPVDRYGRLLINYLGHPGLVPTYSAAAVLEGRLPPETLKDKIVLVGATAVGVYDLRVTPFSGVSPGVEVQATVMENLLYGKFLRIPPFSLAVMATILLGLGVLVGLVLPKLSAAWALVFTILLTEVYITVNYLLFSRLGLQLDLFYPLAEIVLVYLGVTMQRFLAEEKERVRIRKAFESFVAPAVVQEMLKYPERLRLGGERREITILFSDIRGFTTMSEKLDPEALVSLLHDFLNPMTNIIINQGGTIDKYMGDAIMAEFGAPLEQPDHARLACRAALQMLTTLKELNREWQAQGRPPLHIGVGINTGPAAVGNMGSDRLFDYTAIGDNVNLGSRLEGLNKYYGTSILISQSTADVLGDGFILRDMDRVKVKGKAQATGIFELLGEGGQDQELAHFLELFHQGLAFYREQRWSESIAVFEKAKELHPDDAATQRYLTMAQDYLKTPPGPDWEAVTVMDGK